MLVMRLASVRAFVRPFVKTNERPERPLVRVIWLQMFVMRVKSANTKGYLLQQIKSKKMEKQIKERNKKKYFPHERENTNWPLLNVIKWKPI